MRKSDNISTIIGRRYRLEELIGHGGMGAVYRATDLLNDETVALKQVTIPGRQLTFTARPDSSSAESMFRVALAREFRTLASLRHPNIISVLDYGFSEDGIPFFTMELLNHERNIIETGKAQPVDVQLDLMLQVFQALAYLHRRGIIHRDIKPDNVLVIEDAAGRMHVKVLDFGLALARQHLDAQKEMVSGTFLYMAPEVLRGEHATEVSDLYAVGLISYELLAGAYPYTNKDITGLMNHILNTPPDLKGLQASEEMAEIIASLLAKKPGDRIQTAQEVINRYAESANRTDLLRDAGEIRESYLQAAEFVGRTAEMDQLSKRLSDLLENKGSAILIGGESGIGKTRLIEEMRTLAMVQGALVLRGQMIGTGASLYHLWRDALRRLVLTTPISDNQAAILKSIIPDIERLVGHSVPDAPTVEPSLAKERLLTAIEDVFLAQKQQPILLILEDLHWANESLDVLIRLLQHVDKLPLMIVGSFRDDERPDLPAKLPSMQMMKLERLGRSAMQELSTAMLGSAGQRSEVIDLIERETEGNAFFMVEVVRTLAEEAGTLEMIGRATLPASVFAGGIQTIVKRRLARIAPDYRPLFRMAALAGRQIDTKVLDVLAAGHSGGTGAIRLDRWLRAGSDAAVLELVNEQWQFAHDKLRDGLMGQLDSADLREMHGQIAAAIEAAYPDVVDKANALAFHWQGAGDHVKATKYYTLVAEQAMKAGGNKDAKLAYEHALAALQRLPETPENKQQFIDIADKYGRVSAFLPSDNVIPMLERALATAESLKDEVRIAKMLGSLGAYTYVGGRYGESFGYFGRSMAMAETLGADELLLVPYNLIGRAVAVSGDWIRAKGMLTKGIALAEKFNDLELLAGSLAFLGAVMTLEGNRVEGEANHMRGMEIAEQLGFPSRIAGNLMITGLAWALSGLHDEAVPVLTRCLQMAEETHDQQPLYLALGGLGIVERYRGDMAKSLEFIDRALAVAEAVKLFAHVPILHTYRAELDEMAGNTEAAYQRLLKVLPAAEAAQQNTGRAEVLRMLGNLQSKHARPDLPTAEDYLKQAVQIHEGGGGKPMTSHAKLDLAIYYADQGRINEARPLLEMSSALFELLGMTWHQDEARRVLAKIEAKTDSPA